MARASANVLSALIPALMLANYGYAQELLGSACFELEMDAWMPPIPFAGDSLGVSPPPRIVLSFAPIRVPGPTPAGHYSLEAAPGAIPSVHRYSSWERVGNDSLVFQWSTGTAGLQMQLGKDIREWRGTARTFWDFTTAQQTAAVVARPVACDAPLSESQRAHYRFPRGIALEGGDSIRIGELLPIGVTELKPGSKRVYRINARAIEMFSGAHDIEALIDDTGIVRDIRFVVPDRADDMLTRLVASLGPPTIHNDDRRLLALWSSRMVVIALSAKSEASHLADLSIHDPSAGW